MNVAEEMMSARKLLKLQPSLLQRLNNTAAVHKDEANEILRRGLVAELDRMDAEQSIETQRMEKLRRIATARGCDLDLVIEELLRSTIEPELPIATGTEG